MAINTETLNKPLGHSGLGITGFTLGVLSLILLYLNYIFNFGNVNYFFYSLLSSFLLGSVFSISGLFSKKRRLFSILGFIINMLIIVIVFLFMLAITYSFWGAIFSPKS